jgi:chorismate dehydratase
MSVKIGFLTYLNSAIFYWNSHEWGVELVPCFPNQFNELATNGKVDAGIMSIVDYFAQIRDFEPLGLYGIACQMQAQSVLLFSNRKIQNLSDSTVGITNQTSTSSQLLKMLLKHQYHLSSIKYESGRPKDAWLVIGDDALYLKNSNNYPYIYDLGEEWWEWQKLPFVFAIWVVRRNLPLDTKQHLLDLVSESYKEGMKNLESLALSYKEKMNLPVSEIHKYIQGFTYERGIQEGAGMKKFEQLLMIYK